MLLRPETQFFLSATSPNKYNFGDISMQVKNLILQDCSKYIYAFSGNNGNHITLFII